MVIISEYIYTISLVWTDANRQSCTPFATYKYRRYIRDITESSDTPENTRLVFKYCVTRWVSRKGHIFVFFPSSKEFVD